MSTDPEIGPRTLFLGGTIAAGFTSVCWMLALSLDTVGLAAFGTAVMPMVAMLIGAYDYNDERTTRLESPTEGE